jgi:hypothetical protein
VNGYSRWCELYRLESWKARLSPTTRQVHAAGERLFVDYAGQTVEVADASTGELRKAQVFVAVLGASNYTYAEASRTQSLPDWIGSHVCTLQFRAACRARSARQPARRGAASELVRSGDQPDLPRPGGALRHDDPADAGAMARLRHQCFFSLAELNAALVDDHNAPPMRKLGVSRRQLFEQLDQPARSSLPWEPFVYAEWL